MVIRNVVHQREVLPEGIERALPYELAREIQERATGAVEEIRVRMGRRASLILSGRNVMLDFVAAQSQMSEMLSRMCKGSLYAYSDTINQGYVSLPDGIRVGVGGRASCEGERVIGVYEISSLCIRIPHKQRSVGEPVCSLLRAFGLSRGVLIYSPPGVGKTSLLRGCVRLMSGGEDPLRTVVIDTRGELGFSLDGEGLCLDVLSGYPRSLGIEIGTRSLNAQLLVCDEIGDYSEAMSLVASHNCGVPLLASAHAGSVEELLRRTGIRLLHEAGIFGAYVGISRAPYMDFSYDIRLSSEVDL